MKVFNWSFHKLLFSLALTVHILQHGFKAGTASKWWNTDYSEMTAEGCSHNSVVVYKEKGFYNLSANSITKEGRFTVFGKWKKDYILKNFKNL